MPREAVDLLDKMLTLNPEKRISAKEALNHPWIRSLEHTTVQPLKLPQHQVNITPCSKNTVSTRQSFVSKRCALLRITVVLNSRCFAEFSSIF